MIRKNKMKIEEIQLKFTLKVFPYMQNIVNEVTEILNKILFNNFDFETYNSCLFAEYRGSMGGFNHSLALEFLIRLFNLLNNETDLKEFIIPELRKFIIEKNSIEIIDNKKIKEKEANAKKENNESE